MTESAASPVRAASRRADLSAEHLAADIAARVRPVVPEMPPDAFDALVRRMAELELKYRDRHTPAWVSSVRRPGD